MSSVKEGIGCPESTIESARERDRTLANSGNKISGNPRNRPLIESTNRRGFVKKAALATVAAAAGSTVLGRQIIPQSTAEKAGPNLCCPFPSYLCVKYSVSVDRCNACNGNSGIWCFQCRLFEGPCTGQLIIGSCCCNLSGRSCERIGSQRNMTTYRYLNPCNGEFVCVPPGDNLHGIDFYTGRKKRLSITNSGNVGIGTCHPNAPLSFGESIGDKIFLFDYPGVKYGLSVFSCQLRLYHGPQSSNFTSFGNYNGTAFTELMRLTNQGRLGIGTSAPVTSLQVNGSVSARTVIVTSNYTMGNTDFAVLANGGIKVTLPEASATAGMIIFVKNISTSTVTVEAFASCTETDTIEGANSKSLKKQYDSLTLVSNGSDQWLVLTGAICGAFTS